MTQPEDRDQLASEHATHAEMVSGCLECLQRLLEEVALVCAASEQPRRPPRTSQQEAAPSLMTAVYPSTKGAI
jgi:hypothetical protein